MSAAYLRAPLRPALKNCVNKKRYSNEQKARKGGAVRLRLPDADVRFLWPYRCQECDRWHLTKQQQARDVEPITATSDFNVVPAP